MDSQNLVTVYLAPDSIKADLIKNMLEEEGIRAITESQVPALFEGSLMVDVKVLVEESQAEAARKLIEVHEDQVITDNLAEQDDNEDESETESENPTPAP
jgi:hypothetical protein